jgi:pseudaminic acid biosynthesis-associated methylase
MDSAGKNRAIRSSTETQQEIIWKGSFGREYTERNTVDPESVDQLWRRNYGVARSTINESFLSGVSKDARFLEVGCNSGNQLLMLRQMGWSNLSGTELQPYAMEIARLRLPEATFKLGSALALPWEDCSFDVVFTCGVLIHISPTDLPLVMNEIYRTTREYIWGTEYYAPEVTQVVYRDHSELLWKMDFARQYMQRFPDLELVKEQRLPYLDNANVDTVFLLKKKRRP